MYLISSHACTYRLGLPSVLDREGSSCSGQQLMWRLITSVSAENEGLWNVQPEIGHVHQSPPPSKAQGASWRRRRKEYKGQGMGRSTMNCRLAHDSLQLWWPERVSKINIPTGNTNRTQESSVEKTERRDHDIKRGTFGWTWEKWGGGMSAGI